MTVADVSEVINYSNSRQYNNVPELRLPVYSGKSKTCHHTYRGMQCINDNENAINSAIRNNYNSPVEGYSVAQFTIPIMTNQDYPEPKTKKVPNMQFASRNEAIGIIEEIITDKRVKVLPSAIMSSTTTRSHNKYS